MIIIPVLGDGSLKYPAYAKSVMVFLNEGIIKVGYFSQESYLKGEFWVSPLLISSFTEQQLKTWIIQENPELLYKRHPVLLLLPRQFNRFITEDSFQC